MSRKRPDSLGFKHRNALRLMTMANMKTPKGEETGYLTAILYLMPHTSGGGLTLCPHSTEACRAMCLADAGMSALPRQIGAKQRRTDLFLNTPQAFLIEVEADVEKLSVLAEREGLLPAVRLNGTSDIFWERIARWLFVAKAGVQFYDYTKSPLESRLRQGGGLPANYHLTYSVGGPEDMARAVAYLRAGQSVAVVVPEEVQHRLAGLEVDLGPCAGLFVDGDEDDLRFLDRPSSIVLLKPKGHKRSDLIRPDVLRELRAAAKAYPVMDARRVTA